MLSPRDGKHSKNEIEHKITVIPPKNNESKHSLNNVSSHSL